MRELADAGEQGRVRLFDVFKKSGGFGGEGSVEQDSLNQYSAPMLPIHSCLP